MPYVGGRVWNDAIGGIDDDILSRGGEEVRHVLHEHVVFHKVVYDVEREGQVRHEEAGAGDEAFTVIGEKALVRGSGEPAFAEPDGCAGDVKSYIGGIPGAFELIAVTPAEFDN